MPHVSEDRVLPEHDAHDRLLVAALAAGDLAGTDRDHALQLTRSCASCAELHDDLVAISRATAVVPPPVAKAPRDFQLTAGDAARLRPAGWRRALRTIGSARLAASRPLGVGLAALGLVGLLIGNTPVTPLGTASSPAFGAAGAAASPAGEKAPGTTDRSSNLVPMAVASAAAASAGPDSAYGTVDTAASPAASGDGRTTAQQPTSPNPNTEEGTGAQAAGGGVTGSSATDGDGAARELASSAPTEQPSPLRPLNVAFAVAVLAGLAILVRGTLQRRARS